MWKLNQDTIFHQPNVQVLKEYVMLVTRERNRLSVDESGH